MFVLAVDLQVFLYQEPLGAEGAGVWEQLRLSMGRRLVSNHQQMLPVNFATDGASRPRFFVVDKGNVPLQGVLVVVGLVAVLAPELVISVSPVSVLNLRTLPSVSVPGLKVRGKAFLGAC